MGERASKERMGETFRKIEIPILIIQGKEDNLVSYENIKEGYEKE